MTMDKKKATKRTVRYIDFDGGRDYRAWLIENFPSKSDPPPTPKAAEDTPDTKP